MQLTKMLRLVIVIGTAVQAPWIVAADDPVAIPNPALLGSKLASANQIVTNNSTNADLFPKEVRLLAANGVIDEVQAFYGDKVATGRIAATVNARYMASEMADLRSKDFHLWRVPAEKCVIQLSTHEEGRLLIFTRMTEPKRKQQ